MDTITEITLVMDRGKKPDSLWQSIDLLMKDWEERFSVTNPRSEIRALNERTSDTVRVEPQLRDMLQTALSFGKKLNGAFDITILPVKDLWGFGEDSPPDAPLPDPGQIRSALKKVDYRKVRVVGDSVQFMSRDTRIDVGGIAKGYVLREIASLLDKNGVTSYLIAAGGDIVAKGTKSDGKSWRVGIQHPRNQGGITGALDFTNGSIVTSGDYERYRIVNGVRYHHIFDSKTGYSSNKNQSLTIMGPDPVEADILSTGLFGRDAEKIMEYVNADSRLQCLVVDSTGAIHVSDGLRLGKDGEIEKR